MSENTNPQVPNPNVFGYEDDTVKQSTFHFGGNFGKTFMTKFEWGDMFGKKNDDGTPTPGEALDIVFNINGTDKSMRMFPVIKAFDDNNQEVTDPTNPAFITAQKVFNQICTQVMKCFIKEEELKAAIQKWATGGTITFKSFCGLLMSLLPKNYKEIPLDIFMQFQYNIKGDNKATYLEFPKKVSYGKFVVAAVKPTHIWTEVRNTEELFYIDTTSEMIAANPNIVNTANRHPFTRNKWFLESNFANQQKENATTESNLNSTAPVNGSGSTPVSTSW